MGFPGGSEVVPASSHGASRLRETPGAWGICADIGARAGGAIE